MDELLDLVNENDEVIGEVWKSEANSNPKVIHREVAILIHDKNNRVLLQQRSKNKKLMSGYWTVSCAGHVEKDERLEIAVHRELVEELGIDIEFNFLKKFFDQPKNESRFLYIYIGEYNQENFILQKEEVGAAKFFDKNQYLELKKTGKMTEVSAKLVEEFWGIK